MHIAGVPKHSPVQIHPHQKLIDTGTSKKMVIRVRFTRFAHPSSHSGDNY